jgi:hypothetical protein
VVALGAVVLCGSVLSTVPAAAKPASTTTGPGQSAPAPKTTSSPSGLPTLDNGYDTPTPAELAAAAQARSSGTPVAVADLTTETQQVFAAPKGGFTVNVNPVPVRTKQAGLWVAIDTTLKHGADGYSPAATAYGTVTFSPGGTAPLATTTFDGTSYAVSWPGALPAPTVSGSTATYANVLPGVDLIMSATVTGGFSDVLVVHDATAARNPALAALRLTTHASNGRVATQDGALTVTSTTGDHVGLQHRPDRRARETEPADRRGPIGHPAPRARRAHRTGQHEGGRELADPGPGPAVAHRRAHRVPAVHRPDLQLALRRLRQPRLRRSETGVSVQRGAAVQQQGRRG